MGNNNSLNNHQQNENVDKYSIGEYKDRYTMKESIEPLEFYDYIININSFSKKPELLWEIEEKDKNKQEEERKKLLESYEKISTQSEGSGSVKENSLISKTNSKISNENNMENSDLKIQLNEQDKEKNIEADNKIKKIEYKKCIVIGVVGMGNVGKSYLLSLFTNHPLPAGESIHTKGISVINLTDKNKNIVILDSEGVESPLLKDESEQNNVEISKENMNLIEGKILKMAEDKKAVELFIQDFIIENSDILFIVVGQLTLKEQKLIYRICQESRKDKIYVIHNLKNYYSKEQIDEYIKNVFQRNVFLNQSFTEQKYKNGKNDNQYNTYYTEIYQNEDKNSSTSVIHLIMASNVTNAGGYIYNNTAVEFVRGQLASYNQMREFKLNESIENQVIKKSYKFLESENGHNVYFEKGDIGTVETNGKKYIKIKNKFKVKNCLTNFLGFSCFFGSLYSPNYICYKRYNESQKVNELVIEINLCGEENKDFKITKNVTEHPEQEGNKEIIIIEGTKMLNKELTVLEEHNNINYGDFKIDIVLDKNKYKLKPGAKVKCSHINGIYKFFYRLEDDEENVEKKKMLEPVNSQNKIRKKNNKNNKINYTDNIISNNKDVNIENQ